MYRSLKTKEGINDVCIDLLLYIKLTNYFTRGKKSSYHIYQTPSPSLVLIWEAAGRFGTKWHEMVGFGKIW